MRRSRLSVDTVPAMALHSRMRVWLVILWLLLIVLGYGAADPTIRAVPRRFRVLFQPITIAAKAVAAGGPLAYLAAMQGLSRRERRELARHDGGVITVVPKLLNGLTGQNRALAIAELTRTLQGDVGGGLLLLGGHTRPQLYRLLAPSRLRHAADPDGWRELCVAILDAATRSQDAGAVNAALKLMRRESAAGARLTTVARAYLEEVGHWPGGASHTRELLRPGMSARDTELPRP
ncbi:MAG TPA: hypothetical protein VGS41_09845, partial [Chthonomonadales bacterium]|nr:hypothetical protein [Chthonomonadales bacterium]